MVDICSSPVRDTSPLASRMLRSPPAVVREDAWCASLEDGEPTSKVDPALRRCP